VALLLAAVASAALAACGGAGSVRGRAITLSGAVSSAPGSAARGSGAAQGAGSPARACGAATAATVAAIDVHVVKRIYAGEAGGGEVAEDVAHVTSSRELASAVAAGDRPAVYAAVHAIVYMPGWHIVRLRVTSGHRVLADIGGPYIIAPVRGSLRVGASKVGSFVMSVQDDVGYVKLVTRFTGVPIDLYGTPRPAEGFVLGTLQPAPALPRDGASVKVHGVEYLARAIDGRAFPDGHLKIVLLFAPPARALSARSCAAVRHATWGGVLEHVAARFAPLPSHYQDLAGTLQGASGGVVFVREGSTQIAGLTAGPRQLPQSGPVTYRGRTWQVYSWEPYPPARIYFLAPS